MIVLLVANNKKKIPSPLMILNYKIASREGLLHDDASPAGDESKVTENKVGKETEE